MPNLVANHTSKCKVGEAFHKREREVQQSGQQPQVAVEPQNFPCYEKAGQEVLRSSLLPLFVNKTLNVFGCSVCSTQLISNGYEALLRHFRGTSHIRNLSTFSAAPAPNPKVYKF